MAELKAGMKLKALIGVDGSLTTGKVYEVLDEGDGDLFVVGDDSIPFHVSDEDSHYFEEVAPNMVDHPPHYNSGKFEVIDIIEDSLRDIPGGFEAYLVGNIEKYVMRYRHKNGVEDLKKSRWYLDRLIAEVVSRS